ncbi:MAG: hypothetical protein ACXWN4_07415, partial [Candidatus Limnocylindrales bacterium]
MGDTNRGIGASIRISLLISALLALASPAMARAAITVANTNDSGPGSLRQAIAEAPSGETIIVPSGTYTLSSKELKIEKSLTISGQGSGSTTVRAGGAFRVLHVAGAGNNVTISDFTIRDGDPKGPIVEGGGIFISGSTLTLSGVNVTNNVADTNGGPAGAGGIAEGGGLGGREASITVRESSFVGNTAASSGGDGGGHGGIAAGGGINAREGSLTIVDSSFSGDSADA